MWFPVPASLVLNITNKDDNNSVFPYSDTENVAILMHVVVAAVRFDQVLSCVTSIGGDGPLSVSACE